MTTRDGGPQKRERDGGKESRTGHASLSRRTVPVRLHGGAVMKSKLCYKNWKTITRTFVRSRSFGSVKAPPAPAISTRYMAPGREGLLLCQGDACLITVVPGNGRINCFR